MAWVVGDSNKQNMGVTVSVSKDFSQPSSSGTSKNLGETVVKSSFDQTKQNRCVVQNRSMQLKITKVHNQFRL